MCCRFASRIVNLSSNTFQTGFQYTPVDSMATCVTWLENSYSISRRKSSENVPNSRFFFVFRPVSSSNNKHVLPAAFEGVSFLAFRFHLSLSDPPGAGGPLTTIENIAFPLRPIHLPMFSTCGKFVSTSPHVTFGQARARR
jgi:hypothetical protein